ncbi:MAG: SGNH/GDSL hydrolase family protein [Actinomadura sp.]
MKCRQVRRGAALLALLAIAGCGAPEGPDDPPAGQATRPAPAAAVRAPVVMFLGDSYTTGGTDRSRLLTYAADTAKLLGWQVIIGGRAGTGFVTPGRVREPFRLLYERQLAWRPAPDMVIVSGGHNDQRQDPARVGRAARTLLADMRERWPGTHLLLMGPLWGTGSPTPNVLRIRDALETVARTLDVPFIDPLREHWITGDGRTGTGNAVAYILPDRTHPTLDGHHYIAGRLAADLTVLGLTRPVRAPVSAASSAGHAGAASRP